MLSLFVVKIRWRYLNCRTRIYKFWTKWVITDDVIYVLYESYLDNLVNSPFSQSALAPCFVLAKVFNIAIRDSWTYTNAYWLLPLNDYICFITYIFYILEQTWIRLWSSSCMEARICFKYPFSFMKLIHLFSPSRLMMASSNVNESVRVTWWPSIASWHVTDIIDVPYLLKIFEQEFPEFPFPLSMFQLLEILKLESQIEVEVKSTSRLFKSGLDEI